MGYGPEETIALTSPFLDSLRLSIPCPPQNPGMYGCRAEKTGMMLMGVGYFKWVDWSTRTAFGPQPSRLICEVERGLKRFVSVSGPSIPPARQKLFGERLLPKL